MTLLAVAAPGHLRGTTSLRLVSFRPSQELVPDRWERAVEPQLVSITKSILKSHFPTAKTILEDVAWVVMRGTATAGVVAIPESPMGGHVVVTAPLGLDVPVSAELHQYVATLGTSYSLGPFFVAARNDYPEVGAVVVQEFVPGLVLTFDNTGGAQFLLSVIHSLLRLADELGDVVLKRFGGRRYSSTPSDEGGLLGLSTM